LDPVVQTAVHIANFAQQSQMPCRFFNDRLGKRVNPSRDLPGGDTIDTTTTAANATNRRLAQASTATCFDVPTTCRYPQEDQGQHNWGGVAWKLSQVNYNHTTESSVTPGIAYENGVRGSPNELDSSVSHAPVFSGAEQACELHSEGESSSHFYTSGVVFSGSPLPYDMRYTLFAFKSEEERQRALVDARSDGLQYAYEMKGENGCDIEIVYEFFPKPGGGLMVEISQTMGDMSAPDGDPQHGLTDTTQAYAIPDKHIAVVQVSTTALRRAQHLTGCDEDETYTTVIKFSTQFICKATGQRIDVSNIQMSRTQPSGKVMAPLSTDPESPTTFQVDPASPTDCYRRMSCGGFQHAPDFVLTLDPEDAPESCGSFYWDPLLQAVSGDGRSASAMFPASIASTMGWLSLKLVVLIAATVSCAALHI